MNYRLRSDLSKTKVYQIIEDHNISGMELPAIRRCEFRRFRGDYWLKFPCDKGFYEFHIFAFGGFVRIEFNLKEFVSFDNRYVEQCQRRDGIDFAYLQEHGYLREVA